MPANAVDAVLDAAVGSGADAVYFEPVSLADDHYRISLESRGQPIATAMLDAGVVTAVIARLAVLCEVDLVAARATTGTARIRARGVDAEIIATVRPNPVLRAEVVIVRRDARPARSSPYVLRVGDHIDQYRIMAHLQDGGMGSVFEVEHATLRRRYALKLLQGCILQRDDGAALRFVREARAAARIRHPNIVDVFDSGYLVDGRPYFVMELLEGTSLAEIVEVAGPLEPDRAVAIVRQLASALAAAHDHGVVHADVTPSNVMILDDADRLTVKLVDFGLAELKEEPLAPDDGHSFRGTPAYVAPELVRGHAADERSDQYGLGIVLFEVLTGAPPFTDRDISKLCFKHLRAPVPAMVSPHGALPAELVDVVHRCLAKSPADRLPSMRAVMAVLDEIDRALYRGGWRRWIGR